MTGALASISHNIFENIQSTDATSASTIHTYINIHVTCDKITGKRRAAYNICTAVHNLFKTVIQDRPKVGIQYIVK